MPPASIVLVLLMFYLPLAWTRFYFETNSDISQHLLRPLKGTKNLLYPLTIENTSPYFGDTNGTEAGFKAKHWIEFSGYFPAYIEVNVSQTDMRGRDPTTNECLEDAILFYKGKSDAGPLLLDVCGRETPVFDIKGLRLYVEFKRNETEEKMITGAKVVYTAVYGKIPPLQAERQQLDTFVFPSYGYNLTLEGTPPPPPPPPIRRTITIEATEPSDTVVVYVNSTDMSGYDPATGTNGTDMSGYNPATRNNGTDMSGYDPATRNCYRDKVIFYDGKDKRAPVLDTVCGTDTPTIRSTGRYMTVYFEGTSLPEGVWNGMTISYQAEEHSTEDDDDDDDDDVHDGNGCAKDGIEIAFVVAVALITAGIVSTE